ncbi:MAG TPA: hypothetical protein RMH99_26165, partial [Sandaracinaceae bacterium LLY-WYZ-13_1]|nr:hypothetical protein [Sandaracinaceae bacterium LLY-WYZ-13_1]
FEEEEEDSTSVMSADAIEEIEEIGGSDEFELLVDEDVLELEEGADANASGEAGEGNGSEGDGGGGGLISRILGRK